MEKENFIPIFKQGKEDLGRQRLSLALSAKQLQIKLISACMKDKELICNSQHGFTRVRLCLKDLIAFCDRNIDSMDKGKTSRVVSRCVQLDFSWAFDIIFFAIKNWDTVWMHES